MANNCCINMKVRGSITDLEELKILLESKNNCKIISFNIYNNKHEDTSTAFVEGECKNSANMSLFGTNNDKNQLNLAEVSKELNLTIELYSEDEFSTFQEHIFYHKGECILNDRVKYIEYEENDKVYCIGGFNNWDYSI